jgi:hypothetical protein
MFSLSYRTARILSIKMDLSSYGTGFPVIKNCPLLRLPVKSQIRIIAALVSSQDVSPGYNGRQPERKRPLDFS